MTRPGDGNGAVHLVPAIRLVWDSASRLMVVSTVVVVLQAVLPLVPLYLVRSIVNAIADRAELSYVLALVGIAAIASMLTMALRSAAAYLREAQAHSLSDHVQSLIHRKSLELDLEYYDRPRYFDTLHRAQEEAPSRPAAVVDNIMGLLRTTISLVGIIVLIAYVLPWYAVTALMAASVPLGIVRSLASRRQFRWRMRRTASERSVVYLNWLLTGRPHAKELRLYGLSPLLAQRSEASRAELRREQLSLAAQRSRGEVMAHAVQTAAVFVAVGVVAAQAIRGAATVGDLVMFLQAVQRGQMLMGELLAGANNLYESNLFLSTVFEFLGLGPTVTAPCEPASVPSDAEARLEVRDVAFTYPGTDKPVLENVSLSVGPGEVVALVGDNGAGKTTLMKLICRFYDPTSGALSLDGVNLRAVPKQEWWSQITALFQDHAQYLYSVHENIWFGHPTQEPDPEGIHEGVHHAAERAGAAEFIRALPEGYRTMLGRFLTEGAELSGGQWKKLALARTFYRDRRFAILDEPTSGLDPETEARLLRDLRPWAQNKSVLLVTHRIAAARIADRIYVMRGGRITEHGSHDELCSLNGTYAAMYRTQLNQMQGVYR